MGAGIYVLIGKIVGVAGNGAWLAFLVAAIAALPTGLSYAELASRYPRSAGEAVFVERAFGRPALSFLVGYLIVASGVASTAAVSHGFASYFTHLFGLSESLHGVVVVAFLAALTALNHRGIEESTWVNVLCTVTSVTALVVLVIAGVSRWGSVDLLDVTPVEGTAAAPSLLVLGGAALAFYAYIGFEDICNVAEEVAAPVTTIPRAILLALGLTTALYLLVGITAVNAVPAAELAASGVPLVLVSDSLVPALPRGWLELVALFATTNTALFNLIMASRVLYGMARQGTVPAFFAFVHEKRKSPSWGVLSAFVLAGGFALTGVLKVLAEATNTIILCAFFAVNLSLLVIKLRRVASDEPHHFAVPIAVPAVGLVITAYMAAQFSPGAYARAAGLIAVGVLLYLFQAVLRRSRPHEKTSPG